MVDIAKVVAHWKAGAKEDWEVAADLVHRGRGRHGLFFAHLALEKVLKAQVCQRTSQLPPYIHDLVRLAKAAGLVLDDRQRDVLARMNAYALAGRYPRCAADRDVSDRRREASSGRARGARMAHDAVAALIRQYLRNLTAEGIPATSAVLFGSFARGDAHRWSDIDLIVLSPQFDQPVGVADIEALWVVAGRTDSRIEPIPCGERQWLDDDTSTIIEMARREGHAVSLEDGR